LRFETNERGARAARLRPRAGWYEACTLARRNFSHPFEEVFMQLRPATLIVVACVAALFGFAGAASRACAPVELAPVSLANGPVASVAASREKPSPLLQQ
jgi:hypothetical protein